MSSRALQSRRNTPKNTKKKSAVRRSSTASYSVGDLIAAAYDALGGTHDVVRVLGCDRMAERVGWRIVVSRDHVTKTRPNSPKSGVCISD